MISICIKFKPESGWRSHCREFGNQIQAIRYIQDCFEKWPVKHASMFRDGVYITTYFLPPRQVLEAKEAARERYRAACRVAANRFF